MSSQAIHINLTRDSAALEEDFWIRLNQIGLKADVMTMDQAADLVDDLFSLDPCNPDQQPLGNEPIDQNEDGNPQPPTDEEIYKERVKELLQGNDICAVNDGSWICTIHVLKSHAGYDDYKLVISNGEEISRVRKEERKTETVILDGVSNVTMEYPVRGNLLHQFNGIIHDRNGRLSREPEITVLGSTINFGREISGSMTVRYDTEYDEVEIQVGDPAGIRATEPLVGDTSLFSTISTKSAEDCTVIAFYKGQVDVLDTEPPQEDEDVDEDKYAAYCNNESSFTDTPDSVSCYDLVTRQTVCHCDTGHVVSEETVRVSRSCPDTVKNCPNSNEECEHLVSSRTEIAGYTSCDTSNEAVNDPDYYEEKCCVPPSEWRGSLPVCKEYTREFKPSIDSDHEDAADLSIYPGAVIVGVGPKTGLCGETTITQNVGGVNCCAAPTPFSWSVDGSGNYLNSDVISPGGKVVLYADGGVSPYTWEAHGDIFFHDGTDYVKQITTEDNYIFVYGDPVEVCGSPDVVVSDNCMQQLNWNMRGPTGSWSFVSSQIWSDAEWSSDFSCWANGDETIVSGTPGAGVVIDIIGNDRRTRETVGTRVYADVTIPTSCQSLHTCCDYMEPYPDGSPNTPGYSVWPPCANSAEGYLGSIGTGTCDKCVTSTGKARVYCWSASGYGACVGFSVCRGVAYHVSSRYNYEWVCA